MQLQNIHGLRNIDEYVQYKLALYEGREKNFASLFDLMFDEHDNVMVETTDGYRIKKITYGAFKTQILETVPAVEMALKEVPKGEIVGLYMANSPEWLVAFWSILASGYSPLLMNTRLPDDMLARTLQEYKIKAVISDGTCFEGTKTLIWAELPAAAGTATPGTFGEEVLFMSSGTTGRAKLCAYTGENFYYQILDSVNIITACPGIKRHYEGELKQLVLLPLCHVFGFIAVYLWFGFFSRTFVFPRDLDPATVQRTVKKHKVTHIFAVPMVWEAVYRAARNKIVARGDKTYQKFLKASNLVNRLPAGMGDFAARKLLREVREGLFGDSIQFLISGGSHIEQDTLRFFNGIGYHLANGYGMTEIGITSVEKSDQKQKINLGAVGAPFGYTEYAVSEEGHLLIRGKARASRILSEGDVTLSQEAEWFDTKDTAQCIEGRYYITGRVDDLIVCADGENLNPNMAEIAIATPGIDKLCIFKQADKRVAVVASVPGCFDAKRLSSLSEALSKRIEEAKLTRAISTVYFTGDALIGTGEFKLSRKSVARRIEDGTLRVFSLSALTERGTDMFAGLEKDLAALFAEVLGKDIAEISRDSHFFRDLGGTSMDYYALLGLIRERLGARIEVAEAVNLATVAQIYDYLTKGCVKEDQ